MTNEMRDRLVELLNETFDKQYTKSVLITAEHTADHLIENGVIVSPCKVGQTVYPLNADPRFKAFIESVAMNTNGLQFEWVQYDVGVDCTEIWDAEIFDIEDIGKTVFLNETEYLIAKGVLTKEAAEQKLKEMRGE